MSITDNRAVWEQLAPWWDQMEGEEGAEFKRRTVRPTVEALLGPHPGQRVLEIGCGNGSLARYLAQLGVEVVATDQAAEFIRLASLRPGPPVDYRVVDATNPTALSELGVGSYDAAVANMVLMDMPEVGSLYRALASLLRPGGCFVFTVLHPCFGYGPSPTASPQRGDRTQVKLAAKAMGLAERITDAVPWRYRRRLVEQVGAMSAGRASLRYLEARQMQAQVAPDQPVTHWYFHRPICDLLNPAFGAGLVLDGIAEPRFWNRDSGQAALLAARLRRP